MMSDLWVETVRPLVASLLLPPAPFLLLAILCAWWWTRSSSRLPRIGLSIALGCSWLSSCLGIGLLLQEVLEPEAQPVSDRRIIELRSSKDSDRMAILALGSGVQQNVPEFLGASQLSANSMERLIYAAWLAKRTGLRMGFSGGIGWAGQPGMSEASTAQRFATEALQQPLTWVEGESRDTLENAKLSVGLLRAADIKHVLVVTTQHQMPRALRAFKRVPEASGMTFEAAPVGLSTRTDRKLFDWVPSPGGAALVHVVVREWLWFVLGA